MSDKFYVDGINMPIVEEFSSDVFNNLFHVDVNGHTEKKKSGSYKDEKTGQWVDNYLTYLSWPYAWAETKKRFEDASYTIWKDENGRPYAYDEQTGYMVYTSVTINGITHEMWLPCMDGSNNAMKSNPYSYTTKNGKEVRVAAATMFDINKTIMRCLVKNLAMFGLGLYIYAGEDLPEEMAKEEPKAEPKKSAQTDAVEYGKSKASVLGYVNKHYNAEQIAQICGRYGIKQINEMSAENCQEFMTLIKAQGKDINE